MAAKTSAKKWADFNVHEAFTRTLTYAYSFKYGNSAHKSDTSKKQTMVCHHKSNTLLTSDTPNEAFFGLLNGASQTGSNFV